MVRIQCQCNVAVLHPNVQRGSDDVLALQQDTPEIPARDQESSQTQAKRPVRAVCHSLARLAWPGQGLWSAEPVFDLQWLVEGAQIDSAVALLDRSLLAALLGSALGPGAHQQIVHAVMFVASGAQSPSQEGRLASVRMTVQSAATACCSLEKDSGSLEELLREAAPGDALAAAESQMAEWIWLPKDQG